MAETKTFWNVPYRDTSLKESVIQLALSQAETKYKQDIAANPRVRLGYWYDLQQAGATDYNGSNELTFASGSNKYGFPYQITLSLTVPQAKVFDFYGIADYAANPSLQAFTVSQQDVNYPLFYLSPNLYTNEDHTVYLNGALPAVKQNDAVTITLFGTAAQTDPIDLLFSVAEQAAQTA